MNIPGSNNGFERNEAMADEFFKRDAANVAWINAAFNKAVETHAPVMVFAFQADLLFQVDPRGPLAYANSGYKNTLAAFAKLPKVFKKPVLLIQGDLHAFIVDQPLKALVTASRCCKTSFAFRSSAARATPRPFGSQSISTTQEHWLPVL